MAITEDDWIAMALAHGVDAQGGPAVGWLPVAPSRGAAPMHEHHEHAEPVDQEPHADEEHAHHGPQTPADDGPEATVAAFHEALAQGDSVAALQLLHPDVRIYEQGHAESLEEYRAGHLAADIRFAEAVSRHVLREEILDGGDGLVVYLAETHSAGRIGDREIDSQGLETVVLEHTTDGWRIRHVHWSNR